MQSQDRGDIRVTYPDRYRRTAGGPRAASTRSGSAEQPTLLDDATIEAAVDEMLEGARFSTVEEFELETEPGRRAVRGGGPEEHAITVEVDTLAGESAAVLVNKDGVYSWVFPAGLAVARDSARRATIEQESMLRFEIPLGDGVSADRGGLFDLGDMAIGWIKAKVLKFTAGAAVGVAMKVLERSVEPGLVIVEGDDPDRWVRNSNFSQITLPDNRRARILLLIHGTFSSTVGSFRGLAASSWGKRLLTDLNDRYDAIVGFDHYTLSESPDANAHDLLRRIEARSWKHAPAFDAISYSRGGLVQRSLVENLLPGSELRADHPATQLRTGIFVGATNGGTLLAEPENWHNLIDLYTNLAIGASRVMALLPGGPTVPTLVGEALGGIADFAKYLATEAIDLNGMPGLAAMDPDGEFIRRINRTQPGQPKPSEVSYHAVISDFEPGGRAGGLAGELPKRLMLAAADKLIDQLMGEGNDLVVNTRSMTSVDDPADGYIRDVLDFGQNGKVYHLVYFTQRQLDGAIRQWLDLKARGAVRDAAPDPIPQFEATLRTPGTTPRLVERPAVQPAATPELNVEVVWGNIQKAHGDVFAVGHYRGVLPTAAEEALDWAVSGPGKTNQDRSHLVLTNMTRRNLIRGDLGDVDFFPWHDKNDRMVAVCGMGFQGTFGAGSLRSLYRNLAWSVMALPKPRQLSTVLIGAGTGNLKTPEALRGLLAGVADALRSGDGEIPLLRIVEFNKRKADEIHGILAKLQSQDDATAGGAPIALNLVLAPRIGAGAGGRVDDAVCLDALLDAVAKKGANASFDEVRTGIPRNLAGRAQILDGLDKVADQAKNVPQMIRALMADNTETGDDRDPGPSEMDRIGFYFHDGQVRASAIASKGSTVPERIVRVDPTLLKDAARQMTDPAKDAVPELGSLLRGLVVPRDFREFLRQNKELPLVVEVDRTTAPVHWEMLADRSVQERASDDDSTVSIGLSRPIARQLRTVYSPPPAWRSGATDRGLRALVIGDPGDPAKRHNLPGARDEARVVARRLHEDDRFTKVHVLLGAPDSKGRSSEAGSSPATRIDVLRILINEPIDLVHYAGHGDYDVDDASKTGWLFKDGMLTAGEISRVDRVPPLVIANACLTSQVARPRDDDGQERYDAALLPSLADEFFKRGVINYVGTAWPIDDLGAVVFAKKFYDSFLDGEPLGLALQEARGELSKREDALWAAYQHYGDPSFRVKDF